MKRIGKLSPFMIVILSLMALGILAQLGSNPSAWIIPVLVLGGVFILYKYPPSQLRMLTHRAKRFGDEMFRNAKGKRRTKRAKFRVVEGSKRDDDEDIPRYH